MKKALRNGGVKPRQRLPEDPEAVVIVRKVGQASAVELVLRAK